MIRKKNLHSRPKKLFQKARIEEENALLKKYGLCMKLNTPSKHDMICKEERWPVIKERWPEAKVII